MCLVLAAGAALTGVSLRLALPVAPPEPAFLERIEALKRLDLELRALRAGEGIR